ncbi:NAD-dependent epimerase/dehydratase family protein [Humibacillus xanthopallidus]|uniref:Nucleoside-diphosphate-sugar epimerase n=1 Tax=Humibacillus xanthopallidus TaxID=412689 RepID=A0A543HHU3_9MICO|nr:NAD-dependent epimerase/dehydratase family protein [Humibacillus xanthopallidus]TQM57905.1 nucleoside-diphosphate-sugar epimerase [Humibacillus xanthopallidus]
MSTVVVTGATGNLGSAVVSLLLNRDHEVVGLARRTRTQGGAVPRSWAHGRVKWVDVDLTDRGGAHALRDLVSGADALIHLAWAFHPMRRREYLRQACVGVLDRVSRIVLDHSEAQLVHVSSVAAYSPRQTRDLVDETWPREGIPGATYSELKVQAERVLTAHAGGVGAAARVAVVRPCLVGQYAAGGPMLRCGVPAWIPSRTLQHLPLVPVDDDFGLQFIHADDVAEALVRIVEQRASGSFNVAGEGLVTGNDIALALGARPVELRQTVVRSALAAAWHAHLQPLDPSWVDMALQAPWVDSVRARSVLGWRPVHSGRDVLHELVRGMADGAGGGSSALRPRTVVDGTRNALLRGPVARRVLT